jgi:TonB family protein
MPFAPPPPPHRRLLNTGAVISLLVHAGLLGLMAWFAAREGMLGEQAQHITVRLVPAPEPEKAHPPAVPPPLAAPASPALASPPPPVSQPLPAAAPAPAIAAAPLPIVAAPAPAEMPALAFSDGSPNLQMDTDPVAAYRGYVEFSLRSRWNRPAGLADDRFVAEVAVAVDAAGRLSDPRWHRRSGNDRWDASVMEAIAETSQLDRPPPARFPVRLTVRFDVVPAAGPDLLPAP